MKAIPLSKVWAKTDPVMHLPALSLVQHSINVGSVARELIVRQCAAVQRLFDDATWRGLMSLAALHDIGKASPGFLMKCQAWLAERALDALTLRDWQTRETGHAKVSHGVLGQFFEVKTLAGYAIAAGGHHGVFADDRLIPQDDLGRKVTRELNDAAFADARRELLARIQDPAFFGLLPAQPLPSVNETEELIAFITGLITMADWIGSDENFFPLEGINDMDAESLLTQAGPKARRALDALRWGKTTPAPARDFGDLFRDECNRPFDANALQRALAARTSAPGLYIVEAPMGFGKTEAALHVAYRRWTEGGERGLYFALPTQLTSDCIFKRLAPFLSRALVTPDTATLVHGSAWLRDERAIEIHPTAVHEAGNAADARRWFASGRRPLLAPFGAGTLDQALLSVLPAKHCGLRLFALAGKVVVLDEVHSYDPYTSALVDRLVCDLLKLNSTVIVLSATLPDARKEELLKAAGAHGRASVADYPLITFVPTGGSVAEFQRVEWNPADDRTVELEHHAADDNSVWQRACDAAKAGACVLVIRNTVALAQETWRRLKNEVFQGGPPVALLHSRFPKWRRDELEGEWITRLGRESAQRPPGCLLVATQVVEQSVDIDADLLITDLAPTDLLFQRLGRLHRHGAKIPRPGEFTSPAAWILNPALSADLDAKELKRRFGSSGRVYPPFTLYRSWEVWRGRTSVLLPHAIRDLLERTYAPLADEAPDGVRELQNKLEELTEKKIRTAGARASRLCNPDKEDEEGVLTRWNDQPTADLLLLREQPSLAAKGEWTLAPLHGSPLRIKQHEWSFPAAKHLHRNLVRMPLYSVCSWSEATPGWLSEYFSGSAVLGVVCGDEVRPLDDQVKLTCRLTWNADEGIRIAPAESKRITTVISGDEDGWW